MKRLAVNKWSLLSVVSIIGYIIYWHLQKGVTNPFVWDSFGYYLYLPQTIVNNDLAIQDFSIIEQLQEKQFVSDTFYQIYKIENGNWIIRYPLGLSVLLSPFYMIGHWLSGFTGYDSDGFSTPYQLAIVTGCMFYVSAGIIMLRKILLHFFTDHISALVLLILFLGTNIINQMTISISMSHGLIFFLYTLIIWYTIKWHKLKKRKYLILLGVVIGLAVICRPTEIVAIFIPLFWEVKKIKGVVAKVKNLWIEHKTSLILATLSFISIVMIQMLYWKIYVGHFIYNSYNNPGEGLDLFSPHTLDVLFSFRKGWFIYTPIAVLFVLGFIVVKKKYPQYFWSLFLYFIFNLWFVSSWTCWWYASSFSQRALVQSYAVLAVVFGFLLVYVLHKSNKLKYAITIIVPLLVALNIFQMWQFRNGIIHGSRMTFDYYKASFLQTKKPDSKYDKLLVIDRSKSFEESKKDRNYVVSTIHTNDFEKEYIDDDLYSANSIKGNFSLKMSKENVFSKAWKIPYKEISGGKDHSWVKVKFNYYLTGKEASFRLVNSIERGGKVYGYMAYPFTGKESETNKWITKEIYYLTPHIRDVNDLFSTYFWSVGNDEVYIDNLIIKRFKPIE